MVEWLNEYFSGNRPQIDFSLKPEGTDFQKVCGESYEIEYGQLKTYGDRSESCRVKNAISEYVCTSNRWCSR